MPNFDVRLVAVLSTKRRVATKAFEHDSSKTPPIALLTVPLPREYLWCDIIGRAHCRVRHQTSVISSHSENSLSILGSHCEVDGVDSNGFATRRAI